MTKLSRKIKEVAETMNDFFSNAVNKLNIKGYSTESTSQINSLDPILNAILKFKEHPSAIKIREKLNVIEKFSFSKTKEEEIKAEIKRLDKNKPITFNNIPAKLLKQTDDICVPLLIEIYNDSKVNSNFPESLKMAASSLLCRKSLNKICTIRYITT